jgi:subtilisin family serine protease
MEKNLPAINSKLSYRFILILFFSPLLLGFTDCSNNKGRNNDNKKQDSDFYYSRGKKIELNTPKDSIGILLRKKMNLGILKESLQALGYTYTRSLSGDIVIVVPAGNKHAGKNELITAAMNLPSKDSQLIEKAGYVTYRKDGKVPMIITTDLIAEFKKGVAEKDINDLFAKYHIQVLTQSPFIKTQYVLKATEYLQYDAVKACRLLAEDSIVAYAHPDFIMVKQYQRINPDDNTYYNLQWYHNNTGQESGTEDADIDTDLAWNFTTGDSSTIIAIIDEGFDTAHLDLVSNFSYNPAELANGYNGQDEDRNGFIDDILGWNFRGCTSGGAAGCGSNQLDAAAGELAHGTAVMGMAVAAHNRIGVIGSCPECSVIPLQAGSVVHQDAFAFGYAKQRGAKIISCSWQYTDEEIPEGIESPIKDAFDSGITIFFAIDNSSGDKCKYPANISSLDYVIAIAKSTNKDLFYSVSDGVYNSGYGDSMDLLAPGASELGGLDFNTMMITTTDLSGPVGRSVNNGVCRPLIVPPMNEDYLKCWDGTSFATPLTAGVAGLILSLNPSLRPKQVQYLLQDCTDKIDTSAGRYSPINGFSNYNNGTSKCGYGRVNAYEAVKIASRDLSNGGRNGVDIFIRDNYLDWGNTEKPSNYLFNPDRAFIAHWKSPDIKIDAPDMGNHFETPNNSREFESFVDQNPIGSKTNKVYVRVRNRGFRDASNVSVKLYWVYGGTTLPALWSTFPQDLPGDPTWHFLGTQTIANLPYSGSSIAGKPGDPAQIVSFNFDAPVPDPSLRNHYCLLAMIGCNDDPLVTNGNTNLDLVTPDFNNIAHRNFAIETINTIDTTSIAVNRALYLYNPYNRPVQTKIDLINPQRISVKLSSIRLDTFFTLAPLERRLIKFSINTAEIKYSSELTIQQEIILNDKKKRRAIGGFTYYFTK